MRGFAFIFSILFFYSFSSFATNRVSAGTGNWGTGATWSPSGIPVAGDNITILSGHTITMNGGPGACTNLTINGTANWTAVLTTNVSGNLIMNNGGTLSGGSIGVLNVTGTFNVPSGFSATIGGITIAI